METNSKKNLVNLVKLCVGADTVDDIISRQDYPKVNGKETSQVKKHVTRMWPKRSEELLNGGSLFWVIKGFIQARQKIIGLEETFGKDNVRRCAIILNPEIFLTTSVRKRPFQGWRYLDQKDAPPDLHNFNSQENTIPHELALALADIGVR
tara:strand:- start:392 stop:844 length:453 start_codon:yes stop_codon:yes gene_type:complete